MDIGIRIEGGEELEELLSALPVKIERKVLIKALRAGARPIVRQVRMNIRSTFKTHTGVLLKSVKVRTGKVRSGGAFVMVEATKGTKVKFDAFYARFLELGTKDIKGKRVFGDGLDQSRQASIKAFSKKAIEAFELEVRKLR